MGIQNEAPAAPATQHAEEAKSGYFDTKAEFDFSPAGGHEAQPAPSMATTAPFAPPVEEQKVMPQSPPSPEEFKPQIEPEYAYPVAQNPPMEEAPIPQPPPMEAPIAQPPPSVLLAQQRQPMEAPVLQRPPVEVPQAPPMEMPTPQSPPREEVPAPQNPSMEPTAPQNVLSMDSADSSPSKESPPDKHHQAFDLGEDEDHPTESKRERLPSDYDVTEMDLIQKREQADIERRALLEQKEREEQAKKRAMQEKAELDLKSWADKRKVEIIDRREKNKEEEAAFNEMRKAQSIAKNPWEKVVSNVDIKEGNYLGSKDVSRMRQSMISRKNDVKQGIVDFSTNQ